MAAITSSQKRGRWVSRISLLFADQSQIRLAQLSINVCSNCKRSVVKAMIHPQPFSRLFAQVTAAFSLPMWRVVLLLLHAACIC